MSGLDLYLDQRVLALLFVYAAVAGFCLGGVYDAFRFLRLLAGEGEPKKSYLTSIFRFVADVIFVLAAAIALILLSYFCNDGRLRAPAVIGMVSGFFVYRKTVSRLVMYPVRVLAGWIRWALRMIWRLLSRPLLLISSLFVYLWRRLRIPKTEAQEPDRLDYDTRTPPPSSA